MKKLVLSALVMSAFFFASCGGTQEYKDTCKMYDKYEKEIGKAKDCDALRNVEYDTKMLKEKYDDKEKIKPEEEDKLVMRRAEIKVKVRKQLRKLSCKESD